MTHPDVERLAAVLPPPSQPLYVPTAADWTEAENKLGASFPEDYKAFVNLYGSGWICEDPSHADYDRRYSEPYGGSYLSHYYAEFLICNPDPHFNLLDFFDCFDDFKAYWGSYAESDPDHVVLGRERKNFYKFFPENGGLISAGDPNSCAYQVAWRAYRDKLWSIVYLDHEEGHVEFDVNYSTFLFEYLTHKNWGDIPGFDPDEPVPTYIFVPFDKEKFLSNRN